MLLLVNILLDNTFAVSFNNAIARPVQAVGQEMETWRIGRKSGIPDLSRYSHILLSGCEASARDDNPWDKQLEEIIHTALESKKPLLGICYGHQFIARTLGGRNLVRKAAAPEFGWVSIDWKEKQSPLIKGIEEPVCMVSHYDEVFDLPADFNLLADSQQCGVHSYQYRDRHVYGFQFHPELSIPEADEIFDAVKETDSKFPEYYRDDRTEPVEQAQNDLFMQNFLKLS